MMILQRGLKVLTRAYFWVIIIQICHAILYTINSIENLNRPLKLKNFAIDPVSLTIELILELLLCLTVFLAIFYGQKPRFTSDAAASKNEPQGSEL